MNNSTFHFMKKDRMIFKTWSHIRISDLDFSGLSGRNWQFKPVFHLRNKIFSSILVQFEKNCQKRVMSHNFLFCKFLFYFLARIYVLQPVQPTGVKWQSVKVAPFDSMVCGFFLSKDSTTNHFKTFLPALHSSWTNLHGRKNLHKLKKFA